MYSLYYAAFGGSGGATGDKPFYQCTQSTSSAAGASRELTKLPSADGTMTYVEELQPEVGGKLGGASSSLRLSPVSTHVTQILGTHLIATASKPQA